jgi:aspartyl-tRNA(Asn)/glutamyl-tRNA(Gln) amidotransferase subunit B
MLWDANTGQVRPARSKEGSHDYRYFPEPDLPPLVIPQKRIDRIARALPELPKARRERYRREHADLTDYDIEVLTASAAMGDYFEHVARQCGDPKTAANWMMGEVLAALKSTGQAIDQFGVKPPDLSALIVMVRDGVVSHSAAKQIFGAMVTTGDRPADIAKRDGLLKVTDDEALDTTRALIRLGFPVGPSSGLNYRAATIAAKSTGPANIVTVFPDRMERYFTTELFRPLR